MVTPGSDVAKVAPEVVGKYTVVFPPLGRGMTLISLVRSIMEKISQLDEDGQDDDLHLFGDNDQDNVFGDPLQRTTIHSFFGVS
ncbi:hypothetical protein CBR_g17112 [Chara braunii]|uniref:Uncharacterized protein n=1 Tax=Chara braunii TaxID=69332 RepID=A0A388KV01_CHABU|nr:hypothetical protein CBR_g17112 [Chara braunii]|eukprot:GBG73773.1 hypothetical protein CBR_g17112 [Chara braunii]